MTSTDMPTNPSNSKSNATRRRIRSYVLRSGRMTNAQHRALAELWPNYGLSPSNAPYDLIAIFGRDVPCVVEIGFGNGENLIAMAKQAPDKNFLGIEVHEPGVGHCLLQIERHDLRNVRIARQDAVEILETNIPDESLERINLFFPDPWHKKRHHKRRIVQPKFVTLVASKLVSNGIFHVVTDWPDYAEQIESVLSANLDLKPSAEHPKDRDTSRFDSRGARLGHRNWERAWCKRSKN